MELAVFGKMRIAVIGAGAVGNTLGKKFVKAGHQVTFGVRDPGQYLKGDKKSSGSMEFCFTTVKDSVRTADIVTLAIPWTAVLDVIKNAGSLSGKVILDCTNPLKPDLSGLADSEGASITEGVAALAKGASVFKVFNHVGSNIMDDPLLENKRAVMLVCGDDEVTKPKVLRLVEDIGFEAVDAGGLSFAWHLEHLALLWLHLAYKQGMGRDFAFSIIRR